MSRINIEELIDAIQLDRKKVINLMLTAVSLEGAGMYKILNAESEKIHHVIKNHTVTTEDYTELNRRLERTLRNTINSQMLLQFQLEDFRGILTNSQNDFTAEDPILTSSKQSNRKKDSGEWKGNRVRDLHVDEFGNEIESSSSADYDDKDEYKG